MGTHLSGFGAAGGLSWSAFLSSHRRRMADACSLGSTPSTRLSPNLAQCADFFAGMHDLRYGHRRMVPGWRAILLSQRQAGTAT